MRSATRATAIMLATLVAIGVTLADNKYTGSKMCAACHKSGKGGTAYAVWEKSAHAKAYQTLLSDASKKIAKDKGLKTAPHESPECLKCHVTGGGAAKNIEASFKKEEGITCEACHGAASAYKMLHSKGDLAKSKAAGMDPGQKDAKFCVTCHNAESPSHKSAFKLDEMWVKIEHALPKK
ncbi:MAG: cytochrome c family protein [Bacteroidota bacterium]